MTTAKWDKEFDKKKLKEFQCICKEIGIQPPKSKYEMTFFDSYDLCQKLQNYELTFDTIESLSQCVRLDKYYVDKLIMFPTLYLSPGGRDYSELTQEERYKFEEQAKDVMIHVCQNQRDYFNYDVGMHLLDTHISNMQQGVQFFHNNDEQNIDAANNEYIERN